LSRLLAQWVRCTISQTATAPIPKNVWKSPVADVRCSSVISGGSESLAGQALEACTFEPGHGQLCRRKSDHGSSASIHPLFPVKSWWR